jgi:hypothetical protein
MAMKYLAMTAVALSLSATAALANLDPSATGNQTTGAAATAPATDAPLLQAQRWRWHRGGKCLENLGYGRRGTYGCG